MILLGIQIIVKFEYQSGSIDVNVLGFAIGWEIEFRQPDTKAQKLYIVQVKE